MQKRQVIELVATGAIVGVIAGLIAALLPWFPDPASEQAERIQDVTWLVTWISVVIFSVVAAVIIYSVRHFRVGDDDEGDGPPTHGHTGLEIVWTAIPTVIVTAISVLSAVVLTQNEQLPSGKQLRPTDDATAAALHVTVTAQQFAWTFTYPDADITTTELALPLNRTVVLDLQAKDVLHSFWVPEFSQKQDAVPGETTTLVITPNRKGVYPIICTELCGLGHAFMRSRAIVLGSAGFAAWMKKQKEGGPGLNGEAIFTASGCGACHALSAVGASGTAGPPLELDRLEADAKKANRGTLEEFIHESIVDPSAYIAPGYSDAMPKTFGESLSDPQIDALVQFLAAGGKAEQ